MDLDDSVACHEAEALGVDLDLSPYAALRGLDDPAADDEDVPLDDTAGLEGEVSVHQHHVAVDGAGDHEITSHRPDGALEALAGSDPDVAVQPRRGRAVQELQNTVHERRREGRVHRLHLGGSR